MCEMCDWLRPYWIKIKIKIKRKIKIKIKKSCKTSLEFTDSGPVGAVIYQ